jgi:hypothetical protein
MPLPHLRRVQFLLPLVTLAWTAAAGLAAGESWTKVHPIERLGYITKVASDGQDQNHHVNRSGRPETATFELDIANAHQEWCNGGKPPEEFPIDQKKIAWRCVPSEAGEMKPKDEDGPKSVFTPSRESYAGVGIVAVVMSKPPPAAQEQDDENKSNRLEDAKPTQIRWWDDRPGGGKDPSKTLITFMVGVRLNHINKAPPQSAKYYWEGDDPKAFAPIVLSEFKHYALKSGNPDRKSDHETTPGFIQWPKDPNIFPEQMESIYRWETIAGVKSNENGRLGHDVGQAIKGAVRYVPDVSIAGVDKVKVLAGAAHGGGSGDAATTARTILKAAEVIAMAAGVSTGGAGKIISIIAGELLPDQPVAKPERAEAYFNVTCGIEDFVDNSAQVSADWIVAERKANSYTDAELAGSATRRANPNKDCLLQPPHSSVRGLAAYQSHIQGVASTGGIWRARVMVDKQDPMYLQDLSQVTVKYCVLEVEYAYDIDKPKSNPRRSRRP